MNPSPTTNALFASQLQAWQKGFASSGVIRGQMTPMKVNINDDAQIETINTVEGKSAVDSLITFLAG